MALVTFEVGDELRIIKESDSSVVSTFRVISDDTIRRKIISLNTRVGSPIYGDPYLEIENPNTSGVHQETISLEGSEIQFENLKNVASLGSYTKVKLIIGGGVNPQKDFLDSCVITGVVITKKVTGGNILGTITYVRS